MIIKNYIKIFVFVFFLTLIFFFSIFLTIFKIKLIFLRTYRIGEFSTTTEVFLRRYDKTKIKKLYISIFNRKMAANNFVFDLYLNEFKKRKIFVISHNLLVSFFWLFKGVFLFFNNEKKLLTAGDFYNKYPLGTYSYKDFHLLPRIINFSEYIN